MSSKSQRGNLASPNFHDYPIGFIDGIVDGDRHRTSPSQQHACHKFSRVVAKYRLTLSREWLPRWCGSRARIRCTLRVDRKCRVNQTRGHMKRYRDKDIEYASGPWCSLGFAFSLLLI